MRSKAVVINFLVLLILAGVYFYYDVKKAGEKKADQEAEQKIVAAPFDQVYGFKANIHGVEYAVESTGQGEWAVRKPIDTPADRWTVEGMIRAVVEARIDRVFEEPVDDLTQFGLDNPAVSLTLLDKDQKPLGQTLHLGGQNPMGFLTYARRGDGKNVFTVAGELKKELEKTLFEMRDRSLVLIPGEDVDLIAQAGDPKIVLERRGIRSWDLVEPEEIAADPDVVQKVLYSAIKSKVLTFVNPENAPAEEELGFGRPTATLEVGHKETLVKLVVGGETKTAPEDDPDAEPEAGFWVKTSERPELLVIKADAADMLHLKLDELRDRHVVAFNRIGLDEILITLNDRKMRVKKIKDVWDVLEPGTPVSQDKQIEDFLFSLEDIKYVRLAGSGENVIKQYGLDRPDMKIELTGSEEPRTVLTASLAGIDDHLIAIRAGEGPVALVERKDLIPSLPVEIRPQGQNAETTETKKDSK